jgi:rhamnopyranosyl-N-acetylglucosaminyl-diphospho-decaprenol beta-1,3/1,4-galactofuranosyltransferase
MKKVAAVVVTFNNAAMLKGLLNDLYGQSKIPDEIIVVDNASKDNTSMMVKKEFPDVRYFRLPENTGSAGGYYEGIKAALPNSDMIWTLDDDVRLERDSLEELLKGLEKLDADIKLSSVRSVGTRQPGVAPFRLDLFPWRGTLIKSEVIREYGLPIKEFFIYGEDLEYAMRFNSKGLYCYWIPSSVCIEKRQEGKEDYSILGRTTRVYALPFQLYYAFRNNLYVFIHYREHYRLVRLLLYAFKATICILIFRGEIKYKKIKAIYNGLFDGYREKLGKNYNYVPY